MMTAPLQVIALSFSREAGSEDRILAEVDRLMTSLRRSETVRIGGESRGRQGRS